MPRLLITKHGWNCETVNWEFYFITQQRHSCSKTKWITMRGNANNENNPYRWNKSKCNWFTKLRLAKSGGEKHICRKN